MKTRIIDTKVASADTKISIAAMPTGSIGLRSDDRKILKLNEVIYAVVTRDGWNTYIVANNPHTVSEKDITLLPAGTKLTVEFTAE